MMNALRFGAACSRQGLWLGMLLIGSAAQAQVKVVSSLEQLDGQQAAVRYLDRYLVPLPSAQGAYAYDVMRRADSLGVKWRVRRYTVQGHQQLLDAGYSSDLPFGSLHARSREWYPNGTPREDVSYRLGKPDGPMKTFYASGKPRRDQQNKAGVVVKSECFGPTGAALDECPVYRTAAKLAGKGAGQAIVFQALQKPFTQFIPKGYARATDGVVHVAFGVDSLGNVHDPRVLTTDDAALNAAALEAVRRLPRLAPATEEGQPVPSVMEGSFFYYPTRRAAAASND
ncbi:TonB family protein [Hymenobacter busanensis]|uniref:TonB family protein n=1 Tax=Hymenobacter busanensis TaxID=2607656 RepID=A0A7L4ZTL7_9BACT|nr:TonB family protein [Hymenobacter busanensis]KAA9325853.1 TonB family protein [Hymenobacter busanensis]QHJ06307.1 TonB family protein [Hymenobacter busanensis]